MELMVSSKKLALILGIFSCIIQLLIFYPGVLAYDSIMTLNQAKIGLSVVNEPVMFGLLWRGLRIFFSDEFGMLLLNAIVFWCSIFLIGKNFKLKKSVISLYLVSLTPPIFSISSIIWKDITMGVFLLMSYACLINLRQGYKRVYHIVFLSSLFLSISIRFNAAAAAVPLLFTYLSSTKLNLNIVNRFILSNLICLLVLISSILISIPFRDSQSMYVSRQMIRLYDLAGISARMGQLLFPDEQIRRRRANFEEVRVRSQADSVDEVTWQYLGISLTFDKEIEQLWNENVKKYPLAYLDHKLSLFMRLIGLKQLEKNYIVHNPNPADNFKSSIYKAFDYKGFYYRLWIWLVLSTMALFLIRKKDTLCTTLYFSGLFYLLPYTFIGVSSAYRYVWWCVICFLFVILFKFIEKSENSSFNQ